MFGPPIYVEVVSSTTTYELTKTLNLQTALQTALNDMGVSIPDVCLRIKVEVQNVESDQTPVNLMSYVRNEIIKKINSTPIEYRRSDNGYEIILRAEVPAKIPKDTLERELFSQDILSALNQKLDCELQAKAEITEKLEKMENDIRKTLTSIDDLESSIREFLALAADTIALGTFVYQLVLWIIQKKRREYAETNKNLVGLVVNEQLSRLLDFFSFVPRSRITEISEATGIPPEQAKLLMKALCFEHETACFWRPPTINNQVFKIAAKNYRTSIWKWEAKLWLKIHKQLVKVLLIGLIGVGMYYTAESNLNLNLIAFLFLLEISLICIVFLW